MLRPEWMRALKLQKRAARVGFEWPVIAPVLDKLHEEVEEVRAEWMAGSDPARMLDEVGDVLFVAVNIARHDRVDPSAALRHANAKFERRFRANKVYVRDIAATKGACKKLGASDDGDVTIGWWSDDAKTIYFNDGVRGTKQAMALDVAGNTVKPVAS